MSFEVKIIADSVTPAGARITSLQLKYPRFILAELNTHRVFSRSSSSSRAIPVSKLIEQVRKTPAMPVHWGRNQPGMQAVEQVDDTLRARAAWVKAAQAAADQAEKLNALGLHKQIANRVLEPFLWVSTIVTATDWGNFFSLRCHPDAQPEIQKLACMVRDALEASIPVCRSPDTGVSAWHLPYISDEERQDICDGERLAQISAARCARVSYTNHDGSAPDIDKDMDLFNRLAGASPIHASPLEHQAIASDQADSRCRNFTGWLQFRALWELGMGVAP